jgi:two-component system CheB/CheR fusion protein
LFGLSQKETIVAPPPAGISALIFCVFDEKYKIHHHFQACRPDLPAPEHFPMIEEPASLRQGSILSDALKTRTPVSLALSFGEGQRKYIYVLPYERKRGKWRFACLQVTTAPPDPDTAEEPVVCALAEERVCLLLVDPQGAIRSASSRVPENFGYAPETLSGMQLQDLFSKSDAEVLRACTPDTNESIMSCSFFCLDGSKRDVEIKKFSAPDKHILYGICDVSPKHRLEEFAAVTARERRRIGQDLHDSIGQLVTGISLLSRSLSNALKKDEHDRGLDASQISELADQASNQIRQISRGLMPSEIVENGLLDSLRELARVTTDSCGIICDVQFDEAILFPDVAVETHLYRIAQEAVNNTVRHAQAGRVDIVISEVNGLQQLEVVDDGTWREPEETVPGIGMKTMEYRASAIGGQLHVGGMEQGGTRVVCRIEQDESLSTRA